MPHSCSSFTSLTQREKQVARLVGYGLGNKGIAKELRIREATVATHLKRIYRKLGLQSRAMLARVVSSFDDRREDMPKY